MNEENILQWMRDYVKRQGFSDATSLAEQFLKEHQIQDALDPVFSRSLDAGYKVAQEIRDHRLMAMAG
ncbi:MAG: hypothetical protein LLF76_14240 [Planctomycetaceae bacterium]|nr:hypothetical protein [Planctomycetaceae bacterium]